MALPVLYTPAQLERIREIVTQYHAAIIISTFGADALPEVVKAKLREAGVPIPEGPLLLEDAYAYGVLFAKLMQPSLAEETPEQIRARIEQNPIPPSPHEDAAAAYASFHAGQYVRGLADRVSADIIAEVTAEQDQRTPEDIKRFIGDTVELGIARRESTSKIKANLGNELSNWTRDWLRIATSEVNDSMNQGQARVIRDRHGPGARVSKVPRPDACPDCKRLYLDDDGQPKIFLLSELQANGSNIGRHRSAWKPVVGCTHPWCACTLVFIPDGFAWVSGSLSPLHSFAAPPVVEDEPEDEEEVQRRNAAIVEGIHADITKKGEDPAEIQKAFDLEAFASRAMEQAKPRAAPKMPPLFIGPRGGRYRDPEHKEHFEEPKPGTENDVVAVEIPPLALDEFDSRVTLLGAAKRNPQAVDEIQREVKRADGGPLKLTRSSAYFLSTELRDSLRVISDPHLRADPHTAYLAMGIRNAITALSGAGRVAKAEAPAVPLVHGKAPCVDVKKLLTGNLGVARIDMPQIVQALLPAFLDQLVSGGVSVANESVPVHTLKATQNELNADKIQSEVDGGEQEHHKLPVVVSADDFLLDGHHRWAANATRDPGALQAVIRVNLPITALLEAAHDFKGVEYRKSDLIQHMLDEGASPAMIILKADAPFITHRIDRPVVILGNEGTPRRDGAMPAQNVGLDEYINPDPKKRKKRKRKKAKKRGSQSPFARVSVASRAVGPMVSSDGFPPQTLIQNRESYLNNKDIEHNAERIRNEIERRREANRAVTDGMRTLGSRQ